MKLVAAKCPNCGAQIDVDQNSDSTICKYCNSKIIVEDAIEKYKFEISGTVEINNLPKLDNYIKLGERYFNDKEYKEAYEVYSKAIELDPDCSVAVLRKGLCKSYCSNFYEFDANAAINGMKHAYDLLKKKNDENGIRLAIAECNNTFIYLDDMLFKGYRNNGIFLKELDSFNSKFESCIEGLEYLYGIAEDNFLKIAIINNVIQISDHLLLNKACKTGVVANGIEGKVIRGLSNVKRSKVLQIKRKYIVEKNALEGKNVNVKINNTQGVLDDILKKLKISSFFSGGSSSQIILDILAYIASGISFLFAIGAVAGNAYISFFMFMIAAVLLLPPIKKIIINKLDGKIKELPKVIIILRVVLIIGAFVIMPSTSSSKNNNKVYEGIWNSSNGMYVELKDESANIRLEDGTEFKGNYTVVEDGSNYTITVKSDNDKSIIYTFKYIKEDNNVKFYLDENNQPSVYFKPEKGKSEYNYITE